MDYPFFSILYMVHENSVIPKLNKNLLIKELQIVWQIEWPDNNLTSYLAKVARGLAFREGTSHLNVLSGSIGNHRL